MLKKAAMVLIILAFLCIAGCRQGDTSTDNIKTTNNTTVKNDQQQNEINKNEDKKTEEKIYQNDAFKDVAMGVVGDNVIVTGKARVFEGVFQYAIINGDNVVKQDKYQTNGAPAWGDFTISFEKDLMTNEGSTIQLFVYSAKDGSKTNILEIPINSIK